MVGTSTPYSSPSLIAFIQNSPTPYIFPNPKKPSPYPHYKFINPQPKPPYFGSTIAPIAADKPCWWRISLLDNVLFAQLTPLWLNLNPHKPWHLGSADLLIISILGTAQSTQPLMLAPIPNSMNKPQSAIASSPFNWRHPQPFDKENSIPPYPPLNRSLIAC